ncbi:MAG: sigma-70 family RNA polymerase sigma factor [Candidatus Hydrogenedentes bacterium]|nr:sigma-70 family RNA polymerase sigma factor [Candidatus Hydrogenedentota bacterium]
MSELDDWELVAQARSGDREAFAALVRRYQGPLLHFCFRMVGSYQDAEELAQETFVRLHRHVHGLEPKAKFSTFLFAIARNLTLNFVRDMNRRGRGSHDSLDSRPALESRQLNPGQVAAAHELGEALEACLETLSTEHREILLLREVEGLDYDNLARVLNCRKGTVKSRLARARESLRKALERHGGDW